MAIKDANIALTVHGDSSNLRRDLKKANKSLDTLEQKAQKVAANVAKMGAASLAAGGVIVAALFNDQRQVIDSLAKTADALSMTTENLQALQHLANLAGVESKALNNSLQKMRKNLGEAARKGGAAADALADVGLNIKDILKLSPDKQLIELSKAFDNVENSTVKSSIASDIFGRNGLKMLKVMNQLKDEGLDPTTQALEDMGASLSRVDAQKVEDANDAIEKAQVSATAMAQVMTVALAPAVQAVADKFTDWVKSTGGLVNKIKDLQPVIDNLIVAGKALAVVFGARLVAAFGRYAIAQTVMIRNSIRQITFLKGLDFAAKGLSRSLALLGGPLGIITIAATALTFWATSTEEAEQPTKDLTHLVENLGNSYDALSKKAKAAAIVNLDEHIRNIEKELATEREILNEYRSKKLILENLDKIHIKEARRNGILLKDSRNINSNLALMDELENNTLETRTKALAKEEQLVAEIKKQVALRKSLVSGEVVEEKAGGDFTSQKDIDLAAEKINIQMQYQEDRYLSQLKAGQDLTALTLQQAEEEKGAFQAAQFAKMEALKLSENEQSKIKADAAEAQKAIDEQKRRDAVKVASNMFSSLGSLMSTESKALFEIGKNAAIAGAVVDGQAAAVAAYKFASPLGPLAATAAAGASLVNTGVMISNLKSANFSGGGSGGGGGGGGGGGTQNQPQQQEQTVNRTLTIEGIQDLDSSAFTSGGTLNGLFDIIRDAQRNGEQVLI